MAKIPTTKRFIVEEFKEQKSWIEKLLGPLNDFILNVNAAFNNNLTFSENISAQITQVKVQTQNFVTQASFYNSSSKTFTSADVNTGTEQITVTSHGFATGDRVQFTTTGTLPTGLVASTDYWIIAVSANVISLATTMALSFAGTAINLTAAGSGSSIVSSRIQTASYVTFFDDLSFKNNMKGQAKGVWPIAILDTAANPVPVQSGVSVDWTNGDGQIIINSVTGLLPSKEYNLTLIAITG